MLSVLEDRCYPTGGEPAWTPEWALDFAHSKGIEDQVSDTLTDLADAMNAAPYDWLTKRLGVLWTMFMVARDVDDRALTVWMAETASLLADIPHDIAAFAIDEAVRKSPHGFIPSVGEIRRHADPLVCARREHIGRLRRMEVALGDHDATEKRQARRREREAHARHMAEVGR